MEELVRRMPAPSTRSDMVPPPTRGPAATLPRVLTLDIEAAFASVDLGFVKAEALLACPVRGMRSPLGASKEGFSFDKARCSGRLPEPLLHGAGSA